MHFLSNKIDKNNTYVTTITKKIGELRFKDEEEDSFFTEVIFLCIISNNHQEKINFSVIKNLKY